MSIIFCICFKRLLLVCALLCHPLLATSQTALDLKQQAYHAFQRGDFAQAIQLWETQQVSQTLPLMSVIHLASAYKTIGNYRQTYRILKQALDRSSTNTLDKALLHSHLSEILLAMQRPEVAKMQVDEGLAIARDSNNPLILAKLLNSLGTIQATEKNFPEALKAYQEALALTQDKNLLVQLFTNQTQLYLQQQEIQKGLSALKEAWKQARTLPDNYTKSFQLLTLGQLALQIPDATQLAYSIFNTVLKLAEQQNNKRLKAFATGYLGSLYEGKQRYAEALRLTRQAMFFSQDELELLYQWEWQSGRILLAQGEVTRALSAYQSASEHLKIVRTDMLIGQKDTRAIFQKRVRPVFSGLADALLQQATLTIEIEKKATLLHEARDALEFLKTAELQDYFQNTCVSARQTEVTQLENLGAQTVVLYPVLLPDRLELLVSSLAGIHQFTVAVGAEEISQVARDFQRNLQIKARWDFFKQAKQLYTWLITPILTELKAHHADILVIVPDGALRMIPFSALHDGQDFLIQHIALATTPGLNLTDPRRLPRQDIEALLNGLSKGVQGFAPLPNVPTEINHIKQILISGEILLDEAFSLAGVGQTLKTSPYAVVHVASHGQFDRDPKKTFLLTYDDKLTMDRLERLLAFSESSKEDKVELLTLSACQTAVGDERAALGLAGVAVKSGARSALASLWFVNDEATSKLVVEFYKILQDEKLSKAQALQQAQQKLLAERAFQHPIHWAPFLLIGNWL